jgi:hypothetical protein
MKQEEWVSINKYPGYEVSNTGMVRSSRSGKLRILRAAVSVNPGYEAVALYFGEKQHKSERVHRLVLEAFAGPCPVGFVANHKNGIKKDNHIENLEWVTQKRNHHHAIETGLLVPYWKNPHRKPRRPSGPVSDETRRRQSIVHKGIQAGENNHFHRLKTGEVWLIKKLLAASYTHTFIAKMFKVSRCAISDIYEGRAWAHVGI